MSRKQVEGNPFSRFVERVRARIPRRPVQMLLGLNRDKVREVDVTSSGPLVVAFSGGKDSTALALRLAELGQEFSILNTPTGNEPPEVREHVERVIELTAQTWSTFRLQPLRSSLSSKGSSRIGECDGVLG